MMYKTYIAPDVRVNAADAVTRGVATVFGLDVARQCEVLRVAGSG